MILMHLKIYQAMNVLSIDIDKYRVEWIKYLTAIYAQNGEPGGRFKNVYELLNLRALKVSKLYKNHIFQCMG